MISTTTKFANVSASRNLQISCASWYQAKNKLCVLLQKSMNQTVSWNTRVHKSCTFDTHILSRSRGLVPFFWPSLACICQSRYLEAISESPSLYVSFSYFFFSFQAELKWLHRESFIYLHSLTQYELIIALAVVSSPSLSSMYPPLDVLIWISIVPPCGRPSHHLKKP